MKWKDYFIFSRKERNGLLVLLLLIGFSLLYFPISSYYYTQFELESNAKDDSIIDLLNSRIKVNNSIGKNTESVAKYSPFNPNKTGYKEWKKLGLSHTQIDSMFSFLRKDNWFKNAEEFKNNPVLPKELTAALLPFVKIPSFDSKEKEVTEKKIEYFEFNPNQLPEDKWTQLGLEDWQIRIIKRYELRGGKFENKEQLKNIYGISPELFANLEPWISIPQEEQLKIELNTADSLLLDKLKGIGAVSASRIVKYRERLGGFISLQQLTEVYGVKPEVLEENKEVLYIDVLKVNKINLNTAEFKDLMKHPYLKKNVANAIINYREKHGIYSTIEDVKKTNLVNEELYAKIAPYIKTND